MLATLYILYRPAEAFAVSPTLIMSGGVYLTSFRNRWSFSSTTGRAFLSENYCVITLKSWNRVIAAGLKSNTCCQRHMKMGNNLRNEVARALCTEGSVCCEPSRDLHDKYVKCATEGGFYWTVKYPGHCCVCRHNKTSKFLQQQDETALTQGRQDDEAFECTSPFLAGGLS